MKKSPSLNVQRQKASYKNIPNYSSFAHLFTYPIYKEDGWWINGDQFLNFVRQFVFFLIWGGFYEENSVARNIQHLTADPVMAEVWAAVQAVIF
jgi:hypothetical protein